MPPGPVRCSLSSMSNRVTANAAALIATRVTPTGTTNGRPAVANHATVTWIETKNDPTAARITGAVKAANDRRKNATRMIAAGTTLVPAAEIFTTMTKINRATGLAGTTTRAIEPMTVTDQTDHEITIATARSLTRRPINPKEKRKTVPDPNEIDSGRFNDVGAL